MSLITKLSRFARSPQGRKLQEKASAMAKDPETKAKVNKAVNDVKAKLDKKDPQTPSQPGTAHADGDPSVQAPPPASPKPPPGGAA